MTASFIDRIRQTRAAIPTPWRSDPDYVDRVATFLRRAHRYETAYQVERATGIAEATVKNWLSAKNGMTAGHMLALVSVYGIDVLIAAFGDAAPEWMTGARAAAEAEELDRLEAAIAARRAELEGR